MIYVIKTQNNDVILFDSILSFSESYQGSVTSHPVEDGSKISDNIITENLKIKIQGVVTDYNFWNPLKDAANVAVPGYDYNRIGAMGLTDSNGSPALSDAPVPSDYAGKDNDTNTSVKASMDAVRKRLIAIQRGKEVVTVLAYIVREKDSLIESYENCVITDLSFDTSPDGGYAIYPNISIEQVNVVKVKVTQVDKDNITENKLANQAGGTDGKGNVAGTKGTVSTEERESNAGYEYWVDKSQEAQATNAQLRQDIEAKRKRNAIQ
jgi:hypothetical protein